MVAGLEPITRTLNGGGAWVERPSTEFANLGSAISSIGADPTIVVLNNTMEVNIPVVVPSNITFRGSGEMLQKSGTGSIEFEGFGLLNPTSQIPIFSGFAQGDVSFTGAAYPRALSTELWNTGNTSLTDRINRADSAVIGKVAKLIAFPRTITDCATLTQQHWLYFTDGEYDSTIDTWGTTYFPSFLIQDYTTVSGSPGAKIYESPTPGNCAIIQAWHARFGGGDSYTVQQNNLVVEHLNIYGHEDQLDLSGGASTVLLGNCTNGAIRYSKFFRTHGYTATLGLYGTNGNFAHNCQTEWNEFYGIGTQTIVLLNGKGISLSHNYVDCHDTWGVSSFSVLDVEPNLAEDVVEDLMVQHNTFDCRDATDGVKFLGAMAIQAALSGSMKNVTIRYNKIYGANIYPGVVNNLPLTTGMTVYGALELKVYGNEVRGAFQRAYQIERCRYAKIHDNEGLQNTDVNGDLAAMAISGCADTDVWDNVFNKSPAAFAQSTGILETEAEHTVTTSGSTITNIFDVNVFRLFYDLYEGLTVTVNNTDYIIDAFTSHTVLVSATSIGTLAKKTFVDGNVTTGSENIAITAHGHNTGSKVWLSSTGVVPAGLTANRTYFVIRVDADNLKLADTLALAEAGTPVNITAAAGGGTHTLTPVLTTKFANSNTYMGNKADDGITQADGGDDRVYSTYRTRLSDYVPPDHSVELVKLPVHPTNTLLGNVNSYPPVDPVTWPNLTGCTQSGADNKLTKTAGTGWLSGGAVSAESMVADGDLEVTATEGTTSRAFGLSTAPEAGGLTYSEIEYGFLIDGSLNIAIYESNNARGSFGTYVANTTVFKIERAGTVITYYVNGSLVYTSTVPSTGALLVDVALYETGATVGGVILTSYAGDVEALSPSDARDVLELGTMALANEVTNVADLAQTISATYDQAEVQAISDKVDELLAELIAANAMAP